MSWNRFNAALLSGVVLASSAVIVRADCGCAAPAPCAAPCAPTTRTVTVQEWVPEQYQATRTVCRQEAAQESYTAYRTECVAETRTNQVTVYKSVAETHNETRTVCRSVPSVEERTVMKQVVTCVPETTYTHKCVDNGHWECREVECGPSLFDRLAKFGHRGCNSGCGCDSGCGCETECAAPRTRTERVWVSCKQDVCEPCTRMVRHVECVPTVEHVTVCRQVAEQVTVPVTCFRCVPEVVNQTCTVMVPHQVAYQATRTVCHSVPVTETYTACRMVCHTVEKQVACEAPCSTCGSESSCGCERHGFRLGGLFNRSRGCGESCGCESGCGCH